MERFFRIALIICILSILASCGKKGPPVLKEYNEDLISSYSNTASRGDK